MARHVVHSVIDDLDGSPDATTIQFSLDGRDYEIDLGQRSETKLREGLALFIDHATPVSNRRTAARGRGSRPASAEQGDRERAQRARQWALEHGVQLPARGRVARAVLDAMAENDVPALYEAVGLEYEAEKKPKRSRTPQVKFKES